MLKTVTIRNGFGILHCFLKSKLIKHVKGCMLTNLTPLDYQIFGAISALILNSLLSIASIINQTGQYGAIHFVSEVI